MEPKELIKFLAEENFTKEQAYNLITGDIYKYVPACDVDSSQVIVQYFRCKIDEILLEAIKALKASK